MAESTITGWHGPWQRWLPGAVIAGTLTIACLAWGGRAGPAGALASGHLLQTPQPATGPTRPGPLAVPPGDRIPGQPVIVGDGQVDWRGDSLPLSGEVDVLVELADPPAARVYAAARNILNVPEVTARELQRRQQQQLAALQQALLYRLTGPEINATVIGQTQTVLNAILIRVDVAHIERIRQMPGVRAVRLLRVGEMHAEQEEMPELAPEAPARPVAPAVPIEPGTPAIQ